MVGVALTPEMTDMGPISELGECMETCLLEPVITYVLRLHNRLYWAFLRQLVLLYSVRGFKKFH